MMRLMAVSVGRMQSVIDRYTKQTGESSGVSAESMVEAVRSGSIEAVATEVGFLRHIFSQAESLSNVIEGLNWQILVAPSGTGFVICDSPVVVVPPRGSASVGFLVPGAVTYFPLSRDYCLRLVGGDRSISHRKISRETLQIVNYNIAANSDRFIMGPDKAQLVSIVSRSESVREDTRPRFTIETIEQGDDGSLQKLVFQPRRYFYTKAGAP